jgi:hypothetical protein
MGIKPKTEQSEDWDRYRVVAAEYPRLRFAQPWAWFCFFCLLETLWVIAMEHDKPVNLCLDPAVHQRDPAGENLL